MLLHISSKLWHRVLQIAVDTNESHSTILELSCQAIQAWCIEICQWTFCSEKTHHTVRNAGISAHRDDTPICRRQRKRLIENTGPEAGTCRFVAGQVGVHRTHLLQHCETGSHDKDRAKTLKKCPLDPFSVNQCSTRLQHAIRLSIHFQISLPSDRFQQHRWGLQPLSMARTQESTTNLLLSNKWLFNDILGHRHPRPQTSLATDILGHRHP